MKLDRVKYNPILILSIITTVFLLYIIPGLIIFKEQAFIKRESISFPEIFFGLGFILILVFNIVSIIWLFQNPDTSNRSSTGKIFIIAFGILYLLLLIGEKSMADEIGREYLIGWEITGELIILYVFLFIQLIYNCLIINRSVRFRNQNNAGLSDNNLNK